MDFGTTLGSLSTMLVVGTEARPLCLSRLQRGTEKRAAVPCVTNGMRAFAPGTTVHASCYASTSALRPRTTRRARIPTDDVSVVACTNDDVVTLVVYEIYSPDSDLYVSYVLHQGCQEL